jgi:hypothetical protein
LDLRSIDLPHPTPDGYSITEPEIQGQGLYLLRPSKFVRDFIHNNDFRGRKIALFGTSTTGIGIETMGMERLLKRQGAIITGKYYCAGQFFYRFAGKSIIVRKGRPTNKDLGKAKEFARSIINRLYDINMDAAGQKEQHEDRILSRVQIWKWSHGCGGVPEADG